jgi:hypothetical protein
MSCLILGSEPEAGQVVPKGPSFLGAWKAKILNSKLFSNNKNHENLLNNMRLANDIYNHVSDSILFSSNYPERSATVRGKEGFFDTMALNIAIGDSVDLIRESWKAQIEQEGVVDRFERALRTAAIAEKFMVGNCGEMTCVGLKYAYENQVPQRVEVFGIEGGDHVFLVIGRSIWSDPKDPRTWGPSAVICDSWSETASVYPASEFKERLMNYISADLNIENGRVVTQLEPFDPSKHSLRPHLEYPGHHRRTKG